MTPVTSDEIRALPFPAGCPGFGATTCGVDWSFWSWNHEGDEELRTIPLCDLHDNFGGKVGHGQFVAACTFARDWFRMRAEAYMEQCGKECQREWQAHEAAYHKSVECGVPLSGPLCWNSTWERVEALKKLWDEYPWIQCADAWESVLRRVQR
jgi:hypothetical protein